MKPEICRKALRYFGLDDSRCSFRSLGGGHVNQSVLVRCADGESYTLQQLNPTACGDGFTIMHNTLAVTRHLAQMGVPTLHFLSGDAGPLFLGEDGMQYRISRYVPRCDVQRAVTCDQAQEVGAAFGALHMALSSLSPQQLLPMPNGMFHSLSRYRAALLAAKPQATGEDAALCDAILAAMEQEIALEAEMPPLPTRVLHGDPKMQNLLFSLDTALPVCFIDFDNAGTGFLPDDFGDAARSFCCVERRRFSLPHFGRFARGFLAAAPFVTEAERLALPHSPRRMALELASRYLTDALQQDSYFAALSPQQKRESAADRFALYLDARDKFDQLAAACGV